MGEAVSRLTPAFNSSVRVELSDERTSSDAGALALREALEASGPVPHLESTLLDERDPSRVVHPLSEQFHTLARNLSTQSGQAEGINRASGKGMEAVTGQQTGSRE